MTPDTPRKLEIDWLRTAGGAFAAVSSAFLLSTLGAAGTIIGAALGSVIVTVGGAVYSQALVRSRQRLAQVQSAALRKVAGAQADVRRAAPQAGDGAAIDGHLAHAQQHLEDVKDDLGALAEEPAGSGWRELVLGLPWKRIVALAGGLFLAAVVAITAFELVAGRSVSSITGGTDGTGRTTIGRISGGSDGDVSDEDDQTPPGDRPSDDAPPTEEPSVDPTPTPDSVTPEPAPVEPTASASEAPLPTEPDPTAPVE